MSGSKDIRLSKRLSSILRHRAVEENLHINEEGYVKVADILQHKSFKGKCTVEDIKRIVSTDNKQRYSLKLTNEGLEIRANQGHSIPGIAERNLVVISKPQLFDIIHGTYFKNWRIIKAEGLSRMRRNHIHFAKGLPDNKAVISGMRKNCQIYIYLNLELALANNLKFFESSNGVILSPGDEDGFIRPKYFLKVTDVHGHVL